jgi:hypothetical protein
MQNLEAFQLNKKIPILVSLGCLFYIYVLQYPLSQMLPDSVIAPLYSLQAWINAYFFALLSSLVFTTSLYFGLGGSSSMLERITLINTDSIKKLSSPIVFLLVLIFALWSYVMVSYKIGITIYADFDPLPFHVTGLLFYGRLLLQPLLLSYIAIGYSTSDNKWFIFALLMILGCWVSMASGSRFLALLFSAPFLFLFKGMNRYLISFCIFLLLVTVATLTRSFYLPYVIGGEYIQIYANDKYVEALIENLYMVPISYVIYRPLGMGELLMTLDYGQITPSFLEAMQSFVAYFFPFIDRPTGVSIKNIYGLNDDAFGGYSLDMFSIFWFSFGGNWTLYILGLVVIGFILGKTYRLTVLGITQLGFQKLEFLVFSVLFILTFEGRGFLSPWLFIASWIFSRKWFPSFVSSLIK